MVRFRSRTAMAVAGTPSLLGRAGGGEDGRAWGAVLVFGCLGSGVLMGLQLCAALYTLAVYDQALPAGDLGALCVLTGIAVALHLAFCLLDLARGWALARAGLHFARRLECRALGLLEADRRRGLAALGEVDRIAGYLSTGGPPALLDALWLPAGLVLIALLHPVLALFVCGGSLLLVSSAWAGEACWRKAARGVTEARLTRLVQGASPAPGAAGSSRWRVRALSRSYHRRCASAARAALVAGAVAKGLRLSLQSLGFGLGALLVIEGGLSVGELFAWSLIANRLFASLDAALAHARGLAAARDSYASLVATGIASELTPLGGRAAALRS